jgi:hypothetical protein
MVTSAPSACLQKSDGLFTLTVEKQIGLYLHGDHSGLAEGSNEGKLACSIKLGLVD